MVASWYGPGFHGKLTANGETYNQMALTAAHKEMPFGTFLRITNQKNGKSVIVRINDRGPYIEGRDLDLSMGSALALGMVKKGVIKVKVEEITLDDYYSPFVTLN
ncbi:MAG: septal ring lytic transglycosylase RlpA family protein [Melioribacter sp.]|nr:septal ring lytic transglycosylase RlpA family protein [Melioribacter sp.]